MTQIQCTQTVREVSRVKSVPNNLIRELGLCHFQCACISHTEREAETEGKFNIFKTVWDREHFYTRHYYSLSQFCFGDNPAQSFGTTVPITHLGDVKRKYNVLIEVS